jgi:hypothetical protein
MKNHPNRSDFPEQLSFSPVENACGLFGWNCSKCWRFQYDKEYDENDDINDSDKFAENDD